MSGRALLAAGVAALGLVAAIGAGCGSSGDGSTTGAGDIPADLRSQTCAGKIGVMAPFIGTGDSDSIQMNWARVAIDTFNIEHGTDFQIEPIDTSTTAAKVRAGARILAADEQVVGVVGPDQSSFVLAAGPILDRAGLVYVSPSATATELTDGRLKGFYRVVANDAVQGPEMARLALQGLGATNVAIVENDDPYTLGLAKSVEQEVTAAGVPVMRLVIPDAKTAAAYAPWVAKVPAAADVVVLAMTSPREAQRFVDAMTAQGRDPEYIGGDALFVPGQFDEIGAYVTSFSPDLRELADGADIIRLYRAIFGNFATFGGPAYGATEAVAQAALDSCEKGKASREGVWKTLPGIRMRDSVLGEDIAFTPDHELVNGRFYAYRIDPSGYTRVG